MSVWDDLDRLLPNVPLRTNRPGLMSGSWVVFSQLPPLSFKPSTARSRISLPRLGFVEQINTEDQALVDVGNGKRELVRVLARDLIVCDPPVPEHRIKIGADWLVLKHGSPIWLVDDTEVMFLGIHDDDRIGVLIGPKAELIDSAKIFLTSPKTGW